MGDGLQTPVVNAFAFDQFGKKADGGLLDNR